MAASRQNRVQSKRTRKYFRIDYPGRSSPALWKLINTPKEGSVSTALEHSKTFTGAHGSGNIRPAGWGAAVQSALGALGAFGLDSWASGSQLDPGFNGFNGKTDGTMWESHDTDKSAAGGASQQPYFRNMQVNVENRIKSPADAS
ncbi:hypothetical protein VTL71DRAFT_15969 [Oculimacula yallundae]|uniref:Uncharacterized protein n=1 Tax=Oculimacula yallundae TaxID=86028 RepID=A0ABR4CD44_9HELO